MKKYIYLFFTSLLLSCYSCNDLLKEEVYSQLAPQNYLTTEAGVSTVLVSAYASMQYSLLESCAYLQSDLFVSGEGWGKGGSWEGSYTSFHMNYTWPTTNAFSQSVWNWQYNSILYCNTVLDYVDNQAFSEDFKKKAKGEALAIRGYSYYKLFNVFGPTVIRTSSLNSELNLPRSTTEEMKNRIEQDLLEAISLLPVNQEVFGRITKGAALGLLTKFYLNTKQWEKCANTAKQVMDLGKYALLPKYTDIFSLANEGNKEIIWVHPADATPQAVSNNIVALTRPPDYPNLPNQAYFAAVIYFRDKFVASFEPNDMRAKFFLKQYVNKLGKTIVGFGKDQSLCLKYEPDPNANGAETGNDVIELRFSDILLSRAESLNEVSGPTQETIDLINQVRTRAGAEPLTLSGFSKSSLRDQILKERGWEFYYEGKRREDLIRHGKLISEAQARGVTNAKDYHILYPIPQSEMDTNPNVLQNPGY
jgi:hypothetical protein